MVICDVIKQNLSEVGNIDFEIEPNKGSIYFCFLLFWKLFNCLYLLNWLFNFNGGFPQNIALQILVYNPIIN